MRWPAWFIAAALVVGTAGLSPAGEVRLAIRDGLVTLEARDASLREIFAEWARVGQTRVVNAERVSGGPVTLQLTAVPERQALETLLRSSAGFIAAPRPVVEPALSVYDRIVLMPGARPAVVPTSARPSSPGQSMPGRGPVATLPMAVSSDEDEAGQDTAEPIAPGFAGQRPGMPVGTPYAPVAGQVAPVQGQQPALPTSSQRPGVPTAPAPPIKQEEPR
jgi:hypothetical protein